MSQLDVVSLAHNIGLRDDGVKTFDGNMLNCGLIEIKMFKMSHMYTYIMLCFSSM